MLKQMNVTQKKFMTLTGYKLALWIVTVAGSLCSGQSSEDAGLKFTSSLKVLHPRVHDTQLDDVQNCLD